MATIFLRLRSPPSRWIDATSSAFVFRRFFTDASSSNGSSSGSGTSSSGSGTSSSSSTSSSSTSTRGPEGERYTVIKIDNNGVWETLSLNLKELKVHPRDMDVLIGTSFIPSRATLAPKYDKVLVRTENVRALVTKDSCLLFDSQRRRKLGSTGPSKAVRDAFAISLAAAARGSSDVHAQGPQGLPFHLRMLECLFEETSTFFNQKVERLAHVAERALEELTYGVSTGGLRRLLPLKRAITEVEHDIRDTHEAFDKVLNSDDMLRAFCLESFESLSTPDAQKQMAKTRRDAADMLFVYLKEIDDAGAVLEELGKEMEAAQEVWELGLDSTRNRIITTNLYISFVSLSLSLATVPASFFGMNLSSGLENDPSMFKIVAGTTLVTAVSVGLGLVAGFRIWPRFADKRRARDHAALHDLLQHIDDVQEIFLDIENKAKGRDISKKQFQQILRSHPSLRFMRQRELDFMFELFDKNRDGFLEAYERKSSAGRSSKA